MNQNLYSSGAIPQSNPSYPMAGMQGSAYAPPLNYNQPTEVVGGYDARINPMTGQEIPQNNFAGGGLASLVASPYRDSDVMQVKMTPREVTGLQQLAMSYGAMPEDLYDPVTGQPQFSYLKKLLPTLIGAALNTFAPGIGKAVGSFIPGLSEAAASTIGTGLVVGGAYGLIEGDLKKGLEAGLGAYSGANIAQSLQAASAAATPGKLTPEQLDELRRTTEAAKSRAELIGSEEGSVSLAMPKGAPIGADLQVKSLMNPSMRRSEVMPSYSSLGAPRSTSLAEISKYMPSVDVITGTGPVAPPAQTSIMGGIKGLFTSPDSRKAFGQSLGGGFESPFLQQLAKNATFSGVANALSPDPKQLPTGGDAMGEDYVYIPGKFNPLYGTGRDQPYQLPGKYYKKTPQGLVPFNPFALAPGGRAAGGEIQSYADGGIVDPNPDPGGAVLLPGPQTPYNPYFTNTVSDPNVAATRAYIESLNKRALNPQTYAYPGIKGLGGTNQPYVPGDDDGGGGGGGGGGDGSLTGSPLGDFVAGVGGQYLVLKGIDKGLGYLKDKFDTTPEEQLQKDLAAEAAANPNMLSPAAINAALAASNFLPPDAPLRGGNVSIEDVTEEEQLQEDLAAEAAANEARPNTDPNIDPAAVAGVANLVTPPPDPAGTVKVSDSVLEGDEVAEAELKAEADAAKTSSSSLNSNVAALAPTAVDAVSSVINNLVDKFSVVADGTGVAINASNNVVWNAFYDKAKALKYTDDAAGKFANANTSGIAGALNNWAFKDPSLGLSGGLGNLKAGFTPPTTVLGTAAAVLGAYNTGKSIAAGKEGRSAFDAFMTVAPLGGPITALAAAAIAALGASLVTTNEYGAVPLRNYWKAVDQGRGFGSAPPAELAQGFINFYRTNKNEFPGQAKYGRTGNEDFVYDMTQVINNAVKDGTVDKGANAATIFEKVVQPWLNTMGEGPQNKDARRIQDFMMTDLIHNFMAGAPISNAQVKGDKKFKIVSEKPVFAGTPPADMQMYGQMPPGSQGRPGGIPEGAGREGFNTPFGKIQAAASPPTPFSEPRELAPDPTPYSPRIIEEETAVMAPPPQPKTPLGGYSPFGDTGRVDYRNAPPPPTPPTQPQFFGQTPPTTFSEPERDYIPTPQAEEAPTESEQPYMPRRREMGYISPFSEFGDGSQYAFADGGAIGEDYNFGFARGGMPNEYQAGGKLLDGPGDGMSDDIPAVIRGKGVQRAALADGEFVVPADVVSHIGNGSTKAGAKKLYDMMARVRQARTGKARQAPAVKTARLLPA